MLITVPRGTKQTDCKNPTVYQFFSIFLLTVPQGNSCKVVIGKSRKMQTVHEVCEELGISRKTLYFYDKIGLLKASSHKGEQHGKLYSRSAVNKLKTIIQYQDAGLTLKEIDAVLNKKVSKLEIFTEARERLVEKRNDIDLQLQKLDALIQILLGEKRS